MTNEVYDKALQAALADLKELQKQQMEIEKKIVSTKQIIVSLRALLGKKAEVESGLGLKEACLQVLHAKIGDRLAVADVVQGLGQIGFNTTAYANPTSAVKNTLDRLAKTPMKTDVESEMKDGKKVYFYMPF